MIFGDGILKYRDEIVKHTCGLVKIRSVQEEAREGKPYGEGVSKALDYVMDLGRELGLDVKNTDGYAGQADYGEGDKTACVLVHLDVVPEGGGWTYPPFGGVINDGKIYGRGSTDNKGAAIAALYGLKLLKDSGLVPNNRIRVIFGTDEESGMQDMKYYFAKEPLPDLGFSPDAAYPIFNREKGIIRLKLYDRFLNKTIRRLNMIKGGNAINVVPDFCQGQFYIKDFSEEKLADLKKQAEEYKGCGISIDVDGKFFNVTAKGKSAHAAGPEEGINAISHFIYFITTQGMLGNGYRMIDILREMIDLETNGALLGIKCSDTESGDLTLNLGLIYMDAHDVFAEIDIRFPVTCSGIEIIRKIREQADKWNIHMDVNENMDPLYVKEGHPLLDILSSAYEAATGEKAVLQSMGGGTYARTLKNNGVAFGGSIGGGNIHQADEYVSIEGLMAHARICAQAMYELAVPKL